MDIWDQLDAIAQNHVGRVVLQCLFETLENRSGTWSIDFDNTLEVNAGFDPALLRGVAVVSVGASRKMILRRLGSELEGVNRNLRMN
jgi:hypothetical protein